MKKILLFCLTLCLLVINVQAQNFQHDIDQSLELAKNSQKNILMVFSGSDWCKPCIKLRKSILESETFARFSEKNLVLLELDFPFRKKNKLPEQQRIHNEELAAQYNPEGIFPTVLLLDANGQILSSISYKPHMNGTILSVTISPDPSHASRFRCGPASGRRRSRAPSTCSRLTVARLGSPLSWSATRLCKPSTSFATSRNTS